MLSRWCASTHGRIVVAIVAGFSIGFMIRRELARKSQSIFVQSQVASSSAAESELAEIPNIFHYIWAMDDPHTDIRLGLEAFLSLYSTINFCHADRIYLHTNAAPEALDRARKGQLSDNSTAKWTSLILNFPEIVINFVEIPSIAMGTGKEINSLPHKSDFIRAQVMYEFGGTYLDWDAHIQRDLKPLRRAGFRNVVGTEMGGGIISGTWMAVPRSNLSRLWMSNMHDVYDGDWTTHSNKLLNSLARRLHAIPYETLILDTQGFVGRSSWIDDDRVRLLKEDLSAPPSDSELSQFVSNDPDLIWTGRSNFREWEWDFADSYIIHAYHAHPGPGKENFTTLTTDYLRRRQSNFASALHPVFVSAMAAGLITLDD